MTYANFFVPGIPKPGGSKIANKFGGVRDSCKTVMDWRATVRQCAAEKFPGGPAQEALDLSLQFTFPRPKGHFRKNGTLRPSAPLFHTVKPDCTKLIRSTEDALKGIAWRDDSQVVDQQATKDYTLKTPGCWITISDADPPA